MFPYYIKKEDSKDILKGQKLQMSLVSGGMALTIAIMNYFVMPKLAQLYTDMGVSIPLVTEMLFKYSPVVVVGLIVLAIYMSSSNFMDSDFENKIAKYKSGEMIKTSELIRNDWQWKMMILIGLCVGFIVMAVIMPIYNITATIN